VCVLGLQVGAQLRFEVNTTCSRASSPEHSSSSSHHAGDGVHTRRQHHSSDNSCTVIQLAYLRSYNKMGKAEVRCSGGCSCRPMLVDGHHSSRTSTIFLLRVQPSAGARCVVSVTVMSDTRSGGHKFKVTGVMASEVSNQDDWSGSEVKLNRWGPLWRISTGWDDVTACVGHSAAAWVYCRDDLAVVVLATPAFSSHPFQVLQGLCMISPSMYS
jgi:hypothetical protein